MKVLLKIIALAILAVSCGTKGPKGETTETATKAPIDVSTVPQLTEQQQKDGWKLLFDGQTMEGWQIFKARKNNTWEVQGGALHAIALKEGVKGVGDERSDLMTTGEYSNFELMFDWRIAKEGNSGVIYRATEEFEQPYYSGPEYQVIDENGWPGKLKESQHSAADYDMYAPTNPPSKPAGKWNRGKIVASGNHVEHWLNGVKVVEYELGSVDWKKKKNESKWKDAKGYGMSKKGHIDLQDHGSEVWFRNIMIREL